MEQILKIRWTLIAAEEFEDTVDWLIEYWSENIAHKFATDVLNKINRLARFPKLGSESVYLPGCRKTLVEPYHIIFYKVFDETIEIIRVFDGRQNPSKLLE